MILFTMLWHCHNILMTLQNLEQGLKILKMCQDILSIHTKTRCSSFINKNGRITESRFRDDGNRILLTDQELETLYMQCKLQSSINEEFEDKLGNLNYTLVCRESTLDFIFPFYDGVIFVSMDKDVSIYNIGEKILKLIARFQSKSTAGLD